MLETGQAQYASVGCTLSFTLPFFGGGTFCVQYGILKDSNQNLALADGTGIATPIHYWPFTLSYAATAIDPHGTTEYSAGVEFVITAPLAP